MKNDNLLEKMDFGNEAGDDVDPDELTTYFVEQDMFHNFLNYKKKILIATARKGVGKSALIQWVYHKLTALDSNAIIIKIKGADLVRSNFGLSNSLGTPNDHIRDWMIRICALINRMIAQKINFALTDDEITIVESAELNGYKSRNIVGCLLDRFQKILQDKTPTKLKAIDDIQLLKRVNNRKVIILIDDLDATFQKTNSELLELSTFFSACRYLIQDVKDIIFRITLRTDVFPIIRRFDESLDKIDQYVSEILWNQDDFRKLLYMRIKAQFDVLEIEMPKPPESCTIEEIEEYNLKYVFVPRMNWGNKDVRTYKVIYTLSYERPRWAIQLCKLAQSSAIRSRSSIITKSHIDEVWGEYGAKRIDDLVSEHKHQSTELQELLNSFRGCERLMTRDNLFKWINNRILNHINPFIEGSAANSAREIAHFLYRIGFILARSDDPHEGYEHYRYDQMPDFLTSRTDDDFGLKWEIHPCYREALDIVKLDQSHRDKFAKLRGRKRQ